MPQVLLAVCAILVFSFFALSQHRANKHIEEIAIASEIELAATDAARDKLTDITSYPFDEDDIGRTGLRTDPAGLSAIGPDAGETDQSLFDDMDDFDGFLDSLSVEWYGTPLQFVITADVRYVDPFQPDVGVAGPSLAKEIAVTVMEQDVSADRPRVMARLIQVVTPAWKTMQG